MVIDNKYNIGDIVYIRTDVEQKPRIVIEIVITGGDVLYRVSCCNEVTLCYLVEISSEINVLAKI